MLARCETGAWFFELLDDLIFLNMRIDFLGERARWGALFPKMASMLDLS
jgi:hypothetical protein